MASRAGRRETRGHAAARGVVPAVGVPTAAAAARRPRGAAAPAAAAAHPPPRPRGARHREGATLGTGRGPAALLVEEVAGRERSALATRRAAAGFPTGKTFDAWQPEPPRSPPRPSRRCGPWNGCTAGRTWWSADPSGTGKTFLLEALGPARRRAGLKVAWFTLEDLGVLLRRHRADDTVTKAIARVLRADLVVVDDIGLLPVAHDAAEGLYRLVDAAYEKRSIAVSSNLHPAAFDELMPKTLATATVDRLLHHAHVCQTTGDSVRLTQALAGHGVSPLT